MSVRMHDILPQGGAAKKSPAVAPHKIISEHGLKIQVVEITPTLAAEWLSRNKNFRRLNEARAKRMADMITRGEFELNGETIKFNREGNLVDGQHRLRAVELAEKNILCIVVWGIESDLNVDVGNKRLLSEILESRGELNANVLAAAVRWVWKWELGNLAISGMDAVPTNEQLLEVLSRHPDIRNSISAGRSVMKFLQVSAATFLHYAFSCTSDDQTNVTRFFELLATGVELRRDDPIYLLRLKFERQLKSKAKMRNIELMAVTIKAWNAWKEGRLLRQLKWCAVGPYAEDYPVIGEV